MCKTDLAPEGSQHSLPRIHLGIAEAEQTGEPARLSRRTRPRDRPPADTHENVYAGQPDGAGGRAERRSTPRTVRKRQRPKYLKRFPDTPKRRDECLAFRAHRNRLTIDGDREISLNVEHGVYRFASSRVRTRTVPFIFQWA